MEGQGSVDTGVDSGAGVRVDDVPPGDSRAEGDGTTSVMSKVPLGNDSSGGPSGGEPVAKRARVEQCSEHSCVHQCRSCFHFRDKHSRVSDRILQHETAAQANFVYTGAARMEEVFAVESPVLDPALQARGREAELESLRDFGVFERAREEDVSPDAVVVDSRWVERYKVNAADGLIVKSRLIAQEFRRSGQEDEFYSPTIHGETVRLVPALECRARQRARSDPDAPRRCTVVSDVSTAFLHAEVSGEMYIRPPAGHREKGVLWRCKKALYGLRQSPRQWHECLSGILVGLGYTQSERERCWFYNRSTVPCELASSVCVHVDDLLSLGGESTVQ